MAEKLISWKGIIIQDQKSLEEKICRIKDNKIGTRCILVDLENMIDVIDLKEYIHCIDQVIFLGLKPKIHTWYWIARLHLQCEENSIPVYRNRSLIY